MNVLSLFDGISCGQIALERAGIKYNKYFASEIDEKAIKVTMYHYPNTIQLGDVQNWRSWELPKIDLLIGGSPCQGFSFAGKKLAFRDPRSKLFFEFVNILNYIKPKYFLLENVRMRKEWLDIISKYIGVDPICINSNTVSAQNRVRYYWTNIPNVTIPNDKGILLNDILEDGYYCNNRNKSYCIDANYGRGTNFRRYYFCGSRQLVLKNGYSPPEYMNKENANKIMHNDNNKWRKLTVKECERLQTLPEGYVDDINISQYDKYKVIGNGWTVDVIAHIFNGLK